MFYQKNFFLAFPHLQNKEFLIKKRGLIPQSKKKKKKKMQLNKHNRDDLELRVKVLQEEKSRAVIPERKYGELNDKIRVLHKLSLISQKHYLK